MRSLSSRAIEKIMKTVGAKKLYEHQSFLSRHEKENQKLVKPPIGQKSLWKKQDIGQFYYYHTKNKSKTAVVYFHGGAFVSQPNIFHWNYLKKLKLKTKSKVYFPIYPKAPAFSYKISYAFLFEFYEQFLLKNKDKKIVFMGDSAGGNIALSFAEQLKAKNMRCPDKLVLFSPCLDLTLSNPQIDEIEKNDIDPMLSKKGLTLMYRAWAKDETLTNPILSPMFGDFADIGEISLFVGTNEILYPEAKQFFEKCIQLGVQIKFYEKQEQNHAFPLHPIKEAKEAFEVVCKTILNKSKKKKLTKE